MQVASIASFVCAGASAALTASGTDNFTWLPATGFNGSANADITVSPVAITTYTVIGTNTTGCADTATFTVDVKPLPVISAVASPVAFCFAQDSAALSAIGADTYIWSATAGFPGLAGADITVSPAASTIYTVTGTENTFGCANLSTIQVSVYPKPVVNAGPDSIVCDQPVPVQFTGSPAGGTWSGGRGENAFIQPS
ncbi:MAG: hypothetical protein EOP51_28490 [Sphingobacteriales bacterium]|nr:MAG: hypothetical protein EOP51_28490 [Sphingobacteriales bacterium]